MKNWRHFYLGETPEREQGTENIEIQPMESEHLMDTINDITIVETKMWVNFPTTIHNQE